MIIDKNKFPFRSIRNQQLEIINEINKEENNKKYIILEAGTGVGKSPLGVAIGMTLSKAFYVVTTKYLQDQLDKDFNNLSFQIVKGKSNYKCNMNGRLTTCETGPCLSNKKILSECKRNKICDYYNTKEKAENSAIYCANSAYLFMNAHGCKKSIARRKTMIFDEAHNLENQLVSFAEINIDLEKIIMDNFEKNEITDEINNLIRNYPKKSWANIDVFKWFLQFGQLVISPKVDEIKAKLDKLSTMFGNDTSLVALSDLNKKYIKLDKAWDKIKVMMKTDYTNWLYEYNDDKIKAIPLDVSWVFGLLLEPLADQFIFMSATILNSKIFSQSLGIDEKETAFLKFDSPFDPKLSPIYFLGGIDCNYEKLQDKDNLDHIANTIKYISDLNKNHKGIVHAGNFKITKAIRDAYYKDKRFLFRLDTIKNEEIMYIHTNTKEPTILVSSSLIEGIDLKDDLGRFSLIVKCPFKSLGDIRVKTKAKVNPDWYLCDMIRSIVQASGRCTRGENDSSKTYILDNSFLYHYKKAVAKNILHTQFNDRLVFKQ